MAKVRNPGSQTILESSEESSTDSEDRFLVVRDATGRRAPFRYSTVASTNGPSPRGVEKTLRDRFRGSKAAESAVRPTQAVRLYAAGKNIDDLDVPLKHVTTIHYIVHDAGAPVVRLVDLSRFRDDLDLPVEKDEFDLGAVEKLVVAIFETSGRPVKPPQTVKFYSYGKELSGIVSGTKVIHYRVVDANQPFRPEFYFQSGPKDFRRLTDDLYPMIESGATIGELRVKVADLLTVDDPARILINSRRGLYAGNLSGNHWEVRKIFNWQPHCFVIRIVPADSYITLRGLGREFVYHPLTLVKGEMDRIDSIEARDLQAWLEKAVLKRVDRQLCNVVDVSWRDIHLSSSRGRSMSSFEDVRWGATVEFQIPEATGKIFTTEERWLLPDPRECSICVEAKELFPRRVTGRCQHQPSICTACINSWIKSELEAGVTWSRISCPECREPLRYSEVASLASREVFQRYDYLSARQAMAAIPNFRFCLSGSCGSGQIHDPCDTEFRCHGCGHVHCALHQVPHEGLTCAEYDVRNEEAQRQEAASRARVAETSVVCPGCGHSVHKIFGCNHMTCVCGFEFCYLCRAAYWRDDRGIAVCEHRDDCLENIANIRVMDLDEDLDGLDLPDSDFDDMMEETFERASQFLENFMGFPGGRRVPRDGATPNGGRPRPRSPWAWPAEPMEPEPPRGPPTPQPPPRRRRNRSEPQDAEDPAAGRARYRRSGLGNLDAFAEEATYAFDAWRSRREQQQPQPQPQQRQRRRATTMGQTEDEEDGGVRLGGGPRPPPPGGGGGPRIRRYDTWHDEGFGAGSGRDYGEDFDAGPSVDRRGQAPPNPRPTRFPNAEGRRTADPLSSRGGRFDHGPPPSVFNPPPPRMAPPLDNQPHPYPMPPADPAYSLFRAPPPRIDDRWDTYDYISNVGGPPSGPPPPPAAPQPPPAASTPYPLPGGGYGPPPPFSGQGYYPAPLRGLGAPGSGYHLPPSMYGAPLPPMSGGQGLDFGDRAYEPSHIGGGGGGGGGYGGFVPLPTYHMQHLTGPMYSQNLNPHHGPPQAPPPASIGFGRSFTPAAGPTAGGPGPFDAPGADTYPPPPQQRPMSTMPRNMYGEGGVTGWRGGGGFGDLGQFRSPPWRPA